MAVVRTIDIDEGAVFSAGISWEKAATEMTSGSL